MTLLPRLLDGSMKEVARLEPLGLALTLNMAPLSTAVMKLPEGIDGVQTGAYMELFTPHGSAGIFRCTRMVKEYGGVNTVHLTHGLSSMADHIIPAEVEKEVTTTAREAFDFVLSHQTMWHLGVFEIPADKTVTWSYDYPNVEKAFLDLMDKFPAYMVTFDQTETPWVINIVAVGQKVNSEARLTRNLASLEVDEDRSALCTRLYITGIEEPMDADTIGTYGIVSRRLDVDEKLSSDEINQAATQYLEQHKHPEMTVALSAIDLSTATGEALDAFDLGMMCRVCLPDYGETITQRIVALEWSDVYAAPDEVRVTLANAAKNTSSALDGLIVKTSVLQNRLYQQGKNVYVIAETIELQATEILSLRAGVDENAASIVMANGKIEAQANEIALKADKIDLQGFVTATELEAVKASISNLTSGLTTASVLKAAIVNGDQINGTYGSFTSLTHAGELVSQRAITMGDVGTVGKALSTGGELDLQHSHKVTVSSDGVLQLGEVSATGGNFNIADTQFYKDGVSAAAGKVYFMSTAWSGGRLTVKISNGKTQTVSLTQGAVSGKNIPVLDADSGATAYTVNATSVYNNGWNECRSAAQSWRVLINYYASGETLYDADGNVATGPWYKGTEAYRYELPAAL